jgi:hypothetical protein
MLSCSWLFRRHINLGNHVMMCMHVAKLTSDFKIIDVHVLYTQQPDSISLTAAISASDKADQWATTIQLYDRLQALLLTSSTASNGSCSTSTNVAAASLASTSLRAVTCALNACAKVNFWLLTIALLALHAVVLASL